RVVFPNGATCEQSRGKRSSAPPPPPGLIASISYPREPSPRFRLPSGTFTRLIILRPDIFCQTYPFEPRRYYSYLFVNCRTSPYQKFFSIICSRPTTSLYAFSPFSADTRFSWGSDASSGRGRPTYRATRPGRDGPLGRVVPVPCALSISPRLTLLYLKKSARLTAGALAA